jgi:hypothetical protein
MPRKRTSYRTRTKPTDPPVQQRVVFARYEFGWLAVETSALGWRFSFGSGGIVTHNTDWQRVPPGNLNQHIDGIIKEHETKHGVSRL